jgi:hypothetical protein
MILRRMINNLRSQNWVGLSLELIVLVVGVFLGLQVDDWNEGRKDREDEQLFIERLHGDMLNAEALSARLRDRRMIRRDYAVQAADVLFGRTERRELSELECTAAIATEYFNFNAVGLPALAELISSGRMAILQDNELRAALVGLQQVRTALATLIVVNSERGTSLSSKFVDLVQLEAYTSQDDGDVQQIMTCDTEGMRNNQSFLNNFSTNLDRYDGYIRDGVAPWSAQMDKVHRLIDQALGISHNAEASP